MPKVNIDDGVYQLLKVNLTRIRNGGMNMVDNPPVAEDAEVNQFINDWAMNQVRGFRDIDVHALVSAALAQSTDASVDIDDLVKKIKAEKVKRDGKGK